MEPPAADARPAADDPRAASGGGARPPALVIIRGNSASGKSTIARRLQREQPRGAVAVIGQDHVRREMLWAHEAADAHTPGLIATIARHCLGVGRTTVVEGIFGREWYGDMFAALLREHPGPSLVYYLDVSLAETQRRHAGKPIADVVTDAELASWYRVHDILGAPGEVVLDEDRSEDQMVARILADLARVTGPAHVEDPSDAEAASDDASPSTGPRPSLDSGSSTLSAGQGAHAPEPS